MTKWNPELNAYAFQLFSDFFKCKRDQEVIVDRNEVMGGKEGKRHRLFLVFDTN